MAKEENTGHLISLENRKRLKMTGITEVIAYNDDIIALKSKQGDLNISGKNLNINKLNLEETNLVITGHITKIKYENKNNKKGLLKKLFNKKK